MKRNRYKMKMDLVVWEIRKLWTLPMIPVYLALCITFNLLFLINGRYGMADSEYTCFVLEVSEEIGVQMDNSFKERIRKLQESEYQKRLLAETEGAGDILEQYSTADMADLYIRLFGVTGKTAGALEWKYSRLQEAVNVLAEQDASLYLSAAGMTKRLMDELFGKLCRAVITEGILLAALMALYSCTSEKGSRTQQTVYVTRTGRGIQKTKAAAGLVSSLASYGVLAGISVLLFESMWRLGPIWRASMSSQFHYLNIAGIKVPFLTWIPFSVAQYLAATLLLGIIIVFIFYGLGFAAGLTAQNAYKGFVFWLAFAAVNFEFMMITGDSRQWLLYELTQWSPVALWWSQPLWFTDMDISAVLPWQECLEAIFCTVFCGLLLLFCFKRFYREDIK